MTLYLKKRKETGMAMIMIGVIAVCLAGWGVSVHRRLVTMHENINNAMGQIGVQLSACFEALTVLLNLTRAYDAHEYQTMIETIKSHQSVITAKSKPYDVLKQESVISETLGRIYIVARRYPKLKADENYARGMNALDRYEKMVCTSRLIYNDSVTKYNREIRRFPTLLLAGIFGFRQREYLEAVEKKTDMRGV